MAVSYRTICFTLGGAAALTAIVLLGRPSGNDTGSPVAGIPETHAPRQGRPAAESANGMAAKLPGRRQFPYPTDAAWNKIAGKMTPDQAKDLLERNRVEEKNLEARAEKAWQIINQLCLNGYAHEAWELIDPSPGAVREKGLGGFFRDAKLPESELIALMADLQNKDRAAAFYNYWSRFSAEEFARIDLSQFPMRNAVEFASFRNTMQDLLAESYDPKNPDAGKPARHDLLAMAMKQANDGAMEYTEFKTLLEKDPSKDGFTYWEVMSTASPEIRETQTHGQANYTGPDAMVIRAMTMQDPERTMEMTTVPNSHEANYIHIALGKWLENDFGNAEKWYNDHQAGFTEDQLQRTAVAFVRAQVARGEYESAAQWSKKLTAPRWIGAVDSELSVISEHVPEQ